MKTQLISCLHLAVVATASSPRSLRRHLAAQEPFLWYEPFTTVTDYAAVDLDQSNLKDELEHQNFNQARKIYQEGGYVDPLAILTLEEPLRADAHQGIDVTGKTTDGQYVAGKVRTTARVGSTSLEVEYHSSPTQKDIGRSCRVGGNPNPVTEGCFVPSGTIEIENLGTFSYSYNVLEDNHSGLTLQNFSTLAKDMMWDCQFGKGHSNCPYPTFTTYYRYYGAFDYGDQWITAAFDKTKTNFVNGNADFTAYTEPARAEAIQRATIQMNLWMMVIREMEHSIEICEYTKDDDDHLRSWDKAVAYYMGSIAKDSEGNNYNGHSLYTLAEQRCYFANTCQEKNALGETMSISRVNDDIFQNFKLGQSVLLERECNAARTMSRRIMSDMIIPLIQGTLRYAYQMDASQSHAGQTQELLGHDLEAQGAVFAASFLPLLHSCDIDDADLLHSYMGAGSAKDVDFDAVKSLLERNYECLGVTCEDVGGIADVTGKQDYLAGGEPCRSAQSPSSQASSPNDSKPASHSNNPTPSTTATSSTSSKGATATSFNGDIGLIIGMALGVLLGVALSYWYFSRKQSARKQELHVPEATLPMEEVDIE